MGAIYSLLSGCVGKRVGIFAPEKCGKTTLMNVVITCSADAFVLRLIGECGSEVKVFAEWLLHSNHGEHTVLVYSTLDASSVDESNVHLLLQL